ncbi:MAG: response regulator [Hyphomicrobiaceae bacterium]
MVPSDPHDAAVLVVDDDPIFAALAVTCLSRAGLRTASASDGVEALDILQVQRFDVLLVDLDMPKIDGFRLIALLRGMPKLDSLAIMVVSGTRDPAAYEEALGLGADTFLTKPVEWGLLPVRARFILKRREWTSHRSQSQVA